jgi:hypothetical protein
MHGIAGGPLNSARSSNKKLHKVSECQQSRLAGDLLQVLWQPTLHEKSRAKSSQAICQSQACSY